MLKNREQNQTGFFLINLLIIFILGLAPLLWFKEGCLIKSEDLSIPLSLGQWQSYLYSWFGQRATGTYPIDNFAALFFLLIPALMQEGGFSIIAAQKAHFIFWFMLSGFSIYYLITALNRGRHPHPLAVLPAICFYMFNLYLEPVWLGFNIANLSAYAGLPFLAGLFFNGLKTGRFLKYASLAGLLGILLSGIGVNPPIMYVSLAFFILWALYLLIKESLLAKKISLKKFIAFFIIFSAVLTLVNAFWIYPQGMRLKQAQQLKPLSDYKGAVEEGIKELSKYTSPLNVMRFQAAWTWHEYYNNDPYVLYSEFYRKNKFFILLSILPVLMAFLAVFSFKKNRCAPFFILLSILGIVFSTGLHPPFASFNAFLIRYVPGFWIIRSPWYKWSLFTALGFSLCYYFTAVSALQRFPAKKNTIKISSLVFSLLILSYAFPIVSGRIFSTKEERHFLPSNYIQIPQYVFESAGWLDGQPDYFRVMILHSVARRITDWGYAGYEPVLAYFSSKPIITPMMPGSFGSPYEIPNFGNLLYNWLYVNKEGESEREKRANIANQNSPYIASKILPLFNIKYLLHEGDLRWDFYDKYESPEFVKEKMGLQAGVRPDKSFGEWQFYLLEESLAHCFLSDKINIVSGELKAFEALSRTHILEYNNIFEHQAADDFLNELNSRGLLNNVIYYNRASLPGRYNAAEYLLLDTADEKIFYKKEVASPTVSGKLKIDSQPASVLRDDNYKEKLFFKNNRMPLVLDIRFDEENEEAVNLKFSAGSRKKDIFIDTYLNDELIKKSYIKAGEERGIKLKAITLKPGKNTLALIPNDPRVDYSLWLAGIPIAYVYEYNCDIFLQNSFEGRVYLYPKPVNDLSYLPAEITLKADNKPLQLSHSQSPLEYQSLPFKVPAGSKNLSFVQHGDEGYYVLVGPSDFQASRITPLKKDQLSPVCLKLRTQNFKAGGQFLFFLESYDPHWTAGLETALRPQSKYESHFIANGYANGWLIDGEQKVGHEPRLVLQYTVQRQFKIGLAVSAGILICCLAGLTAAFAKAGRRPNKGKTA